MTPAGRPPIGRALGLLLAVVMLLFSSSCMPPPVTRTRSVAAVNSLLVVSEMREEGSTVWAFNPANLQDKRLLGNFPHQRGFPLRGVVSPDGTSIALVQLPPGADRFSGARLLIMLRDGSSQRTLEEGIDYDIVPIWSPDSREMAFVKRAGPASAGTAPGVSEVPPSPSPTEVYAAGADGKNRRLLFKDAQSLDLYLVGWQNDVKRIVYRKFTKAGDEVWAFDLASGQSQRLSSLSKSPAYGVKLSPDGNTLIASVRQDNGFDVITESLDGQNRRVLSKGNRRPSSPLFAPDGRRIAFDVETTDQGASVGIMDTGPETVTRLSSPSGSKEIPLSFSPDGVWILVRVNQEGRSRVYLLRVNDGTKEHLDSAYWIEPIGWTRG